MCSSLTKCISQTKQEHLCISIRMIGCVSTEKVSLHFDPADLRRQIPMMSFIAFVKAVCEVVKGFAATQRM